MEPPIDDMCHNIIMEYLMHSCYKNTAKAFDKDFKKQSQYYTISVATPPPLPSLSQDAMDVDQDENGTTDGNVLVKDEKAWALLDARKDLYDAIQSGDIPQAFDLIQKRFPGLIQCSVFNKDYDNDSSSSSNTTTTTTIKNNSMTDIDTDDQDAEEIARTSRVLFKLRCQQFIEIVRSATELEAIHYAHQYLQPLRKDYEDMITEVAYLIAYTEPEKCKEAQQLLSQERRRQLADEVNCIVLAYCKMPEQTSIEKLHKHHQVVQQELDALKKMDEKACSREKLAL